MERLLLKMPEAMAILNVSRTKFYELVNSGKIPVVRLGTRAVRIPAEELRKFVEEQTAEQNEKSNERD